MNRVPGEPSVWPVSRQPCRASAGSDYHGANKLVALGDTKLDGAAALPEGLRRFLAETAA